MGSRSVAILAILTPFGVTLAQEPAVAPALGYVDSFQLNYIKNPSNASYVYLSNGGFHGYKDEGTICANIYTVSPTQDLLQCCSCPITGDSLTCLTGVQLAGLNRAADIKVLFSLPKSPNITINLPPSICRADAPISRAELLSEFATGGRAWATHVHLNTENPPGQFIIGITETEFSKTPLGSSELQGLSSDCAKMPNFTIPSNLCGTTTTVCQCRGPVSSASVENHSRNSHGLP
jgi:hypothetical protein